jgi:hypothetical protein
MEHAGKQQEIAKADEQNLPQYAHNLMPYPPRLHPFLYRFGHQISVNQTAQERNTAKKQRNKQYAALIETQSERLQQIEDKEYYETVYQAIFYPVAIPLERIFAS